MHVSLDSALGRQRRLNSVGESVLQIAPSAAAAYSLRSLTGGDPKVVRVRRGSDNHEQDFTASEVSSGALTSFVNAQVVAPLDIQALSATGRDGDFLIAKAAYSLRSLGTRQATLAATGDTVARADGKFVAQVRRSSDDALKSFTATEITDGTLLSFVGTGGSDNGFVKTWYDQSVSDQAGDTATGNHAVQATAAEQPKIVDAGSLIAMNGKPAFQFTSSSLHYFDMTSEISGISDFSTFFVSEVVDRSGRGIIVAKDHLNYLRMRDVDFQFEANNTDSGAINFNSTLTDGGQFSLAFIRGSNTLTAYVDGVTQSNTVSNSDNFAINKLFGRDINFQTWINKAQELIFYTDDQTDNRTAIEANIGEAYSIDLPSGVDPGFDQVDGFVETWYDQSGNSNDAVQATAGSQPKIVNAGSLVTDSNGHPDIDFDGSDFLLKTPFTQGDLAQVNTIFTVAKLNVAQDSNRKIYDGTNSVKRNMLFLSTNGSGEFAFFADDVISTGVTATNDKKLFSALFNGASSELFIDGASGASGDVGDYPMSGVTIGKNHSGDLNFWLGQIQEIIIYNADQSANRPALETNINSHYSIF